MSPSQDKSDDSIPGTVALPEAMKALLEASALLLATSSTPDVLSGILDLARQVISADAYAVWRTHDTRRWRVMAAYGLSPAYRTEFDLADPITPFFQTVPDVSAEPGLAHLMPLYKAEGVLSLMVVPLKLQHSMPDGPNAGTITFYWRTLRAFTELDGVYASALANLSTAALNLSDLYEMNLREKARLAFLAEASAVLASSLDYETTLEQVARLAVEKIADWCTVHVIENGAPTRLVVAHADPSQLTLVEEYSTRYPEQITEDRGLGKVLRTGEKEVVPHITDEMICAAALDDEHLRMLRALRLTGSILVPLCAQDKVLGAIRLLSAGDRRFNEDDVSLAQDLARRAATSIENARLHRAVIEQEKSLRLAHTVGKMGSWSWDLERNQLFWSDEFKILHGMPTDTKSGYEGGVSLIHPEERDAILAQVASALASSDEVILTEHRAVTADGRVLWINSRGRIERDGNGKATALSGISIDVTERRQAEDALRRTEKLAAAGRLAATVAHEINNPLEAIVNLIYLAKMAPGLPVEAGEHLSTAEDELNRMAQIVRQTLGFYRESIQARRSNIGHVVSDILNLYRSRMHTRSIQCAVDLDPDLSAHVVAGEIKQVVANLISNAIDATAPRGEIHISVKQVGEGVSIAIADTGTGIEPANLARLFEPFFTTKSDVGTGLGLWVSKGIVEKHHGTIAITSSTDARDHGTTVTVTLPLGDSTPDTAP